jgi:hypothetical protein
MTGVRSQETGDGRRETGAGDDRGWSLSPVSCLLLFFCLVLPVLAHGCHGDDVDHEPAATRHEPEQTR